jgi:acyl carrier protein
VTRDDIVATLADVLGGIAPDVDVTTVDPKRVLREELDLDSMDLLSVYRELHARLQIDIPEADYPELATLDGLVAYVQRKRG